MKNPPVALLRNSKSAISIYPAEYIRQNLLKNLAGVEASLRASYYCLPEVIYYVVISISYTVIYIPL